MDERVKPSDKVVLSGVEYTKIKALGAGTLATGYLITNQAGEQFCLKRLNTASRAISEDVAEFEQEVPNLQKMQAIGASFAPRLFAFGKDVEGVPYNIQEFVGGDYGEPKLKPSSVLEYLSILEKLIDAYKTLHQNGLALPDLHADDLRWNGKDIKIIDWNLLKTDKESMDHDWEVVANWLFKEFTSEGDIYSTKLYPSTMGMKRGYFPGSKKYGDLDIGIQTFIHSLCAPKKFPYFSESQSPDGWKNDIAFYKKVFVLAEQSQFKKAIEEFRWSDSSDRMKKAALLHLQKKAQDPNLQAQVQTQLAKINATIQSSMQNRLHSGIENIDANRDLAEGFLSDYAHWQPEDSFGVYSLNTLIIAKKFPVESQKLLSTIQYMETGAYDKAGTVLDNLSARLPFDYKTQDEKRALQKLQSICEGFVYIARGKQYLEAGNASKAREQFTLATASDPDNLEAANLLESLPQQQETDSPKASLPSETEINDLKTQLTALQEQLKILQQLTGEKIVILEKSNSDLQTTVTNLAAQIAQLTKDHQALTGQVIELRAQLQAGTPSIHSPKETELRKNDESGVVDYRQQTNQLLAAGDTGKQVVEILLGQREFTPQEREEITEIVVQELLKGMNETQRLQYAEFIKARTYTSSQLRRARVQKSNAQINTPQEREKWDGSIRQLELELSRAEKQLQDLRTSILEKSRKT